MIGYHQGYQDSGITGPTGLGGLKDVLEKDAPGEATAPQDNGKEMDEVEAPKGKNFESTFTLYNILVHDVFKSRGVLVCWKKKKAIYSRNAGEFSSHIAPISCVPVYNTDFEKILFDVFVSLAKTRMEKK